MVFIPVLWTLTCDVQLDSRFEVKYPCFPTAWDLVQKIQENLDLVSKIQAVGHMIVWYQ